MGVLNDMYLWKQSNTQCVSQTEGCTNRKETVITDTKLGSIFYNVLQNFTVINVHEVSYIVHMTKSTYSSADDIFSNYCTIKHNSRGKNKERLLYKQV
jgi:hypothetical protein